MRKRKTKIILLILSVLFFFGTIGILISLNNADKLTEENTTEYSAIVSSIQITDTGKHITAEIYTEEYTNPLLVSTNITKHFDINNINSLCSGDKILFRIEDNKKDQLNAVEFVAIVSLMTEKGDIFSLSDYNMYMSASATPARTACVCLSVLFFSVSVYLTFAIKRHR